MGYLNPGESGLLDHLRDVARRLTSDRGEGTGNPTTYPKTTLDLMQSRSRVRPHLHGVHRLPSRTWRHRTAGPRPHQASGRPVQPG